MEFRQLLPEPATVDVAELLTSTDLAGGAPEGRPYTLLNFISTVDGRVAFAGRSGPLGDEGDRYLFHTLREQVDAVIAGTGTIRTERYGRLVRDPDRRLRRSDRGLKPEPLAVVISRSGAVPLEIPLFACTESRVLVFTPVELDTSTAGAQVQTVVVDRGELTLTTVLRELRIAHGVRSLLCEGGPTLAGSMLHEGLIDELFLSIAPSLAGGGGAPTLASGPELPELRQLQLVWELERAGTLYLRYRVRAGV